MNDNTNETLKSLLNEIRNLKPYRFRYGKVFKLSVIFLKYDDVINIILKYMGDQNNGI